MINSNYRQRKSYRAFGSYFFRFCSRVHQSAVRFPRQHLSVQWHRSQSYVKSKVFLLPAALVSTSLILASCSSSPAPPSHAAASTLTFVNAPDSTYTNNFNPYGTSDAALEAPLMEIYEPLVYIDQYTGQVIPKLAASYQYINGNSAIVFNLRKGVTWSNGTPFTSADVVFTLDMVLHYPAIDTNSLSSLISSVSTNGKYQVTVDLKAPNATALYWIGSQTPIVPESIWSHVGNPANYTDTNPVTTGPFVLKSFSPSMLVFERNSHYWGGEPAVKYIDDPLYLGNTSASLEMAKGNFDAATQFIPSIKSTLISRNLAHYGYWFPAMSDNVLITNDGVYPYSLLALRQAISYSIDRAKLGRLGEYGYETPANATGLPDNPANEKYISKSVVSQYPLAYNQSKAKTILKAAGFTWNSGGQLIDPHGKPVTPTMIALSGATDWISDAQLISGELKAIGITASVDTPSYSTFDSDLADGSFDLAIDNTSSGPGPYYIYNPLLSSSFTAPEGQSAPSNYERWNSSSANSLLSSYVSATSFSAQRSIMVQLEKMVASQLPVIPLLDFPSWEEYNTARFTGWPDAGNPYAMFAYNPFDTMYIFTHIRPVR